MEFTASKNIFWLDRVAKNVPLADWECQDYSRDFKILILLLGSVYSEAWPLLSTCSLLYNSM